MDEAGSIPCCVFPVGLFPLIRSGKGKSSIPWEWELSRTGRQEEHSGEKDTDHPHLDLGTREGGKMEGAKIPGDISRGGCSGNGQNPQI